MNTYIEEAPTMFKDEITHAIKNGDRRLLNCIELTIIRNSKLTPPEMSKKAFAAGIAETPLGLVILWSEHMDFECDACEGSGEIEVDGKKKSYTFDCPACNGTGEDEDATPEISETPVHTDIDLNIVIAPPEGTEFNQFMFENPLSKIQEKLKIQKALNAKH